MSRRDGKHSPPEVAPDPPPAGDKKPGARAKNMTSVNLYSDVAEWAKALADERGVKIGVYLDARLREWLFNEYKSLRQRQASSMGLKAPPPPTEE